MAQFLSYISCKIIIFKPFTKLLIIQRINNILTGTMLEMLSAIPLGITVALSLMSVLLFLLHGYFAQYFDYWKKQGVKFEKPVPVFGTLSSMFLMKEHIADNARRLCEKYSGEPYFGLFQGRTPTLMVTDLELIKRIFVKDFAHFSDHSTRVNYD